MPPFSLILLSRFAIDYYAITLMPFHFADDIIRYAAIIDISCHCH
jgi:hypothetical protein